MASGSAMNAPTNDLSNALLLFQYAIGERDEIAWASIYELYSPLVRSWTARFLSGIRLDCQEIESLVNAAFAQFARAFSAEKLARSGSAAAILRYLKLCTRTAVGNEVRRLQARWRESSLDGMALIECAGTALDDSASAIVESVSAQELWRIVLEELHGEDERVLLYLTYMLGMKPSEISSQYSRLFPSVDDVYRLKQSIRERLARSHRIQAFRSGAPLPEGKHGRLRAAQPVIFPLSAQAESTQAVPQVKYRQQVNFCGKPGCRKCREGIGHGPYWYSYRVVDGRTVSTYIGKELSDAHRCGSGQEKPVRYHLQKTFCGKKNCRRCQEGVGHGPYWFGYHIVNGRSIRRYIGKTLPDGVTAHGGSAPIVRLEEPVHDREP